MKYAILISVLFFVSCKKDSAPVNKNVIVKASVQTGTSPDGSIKWKPGIIFSNTVTATGTAVVEWYFGGLPGRPYSTNRHMLNFTISGNSNAYFELDTAGPLDPSFTADSARIKSFTLTSGGYNVTIVNN